MAHDPVASRYAEALFQTAKAQKSVDALRRQLDKLKGLLEARPALGQFLSDPGVRTDEKIGLLKRALGAEGSESLEAFLRMVVAFGRASLLATIAEAYSERVDEDQGLIRAVVRSAFPLKSAARKRLHQRLEAMEGKKVELISEEDPDLIGGLQVVLGHRVVDHSVSRQLQELSQQLTTLRVH